MIYGETYHLLQGTCASKLLLTAGLTSRQRIRTALKTPLFEAGIAELRRTAGLTSVVGRLTGLLPASERQTAMHHNLHATPPKGGQPSVGPRGQHLRSVGLIFPHFRLLLQVLLHLREAFGTPQSTALVVGGLPCHGCG